MVTIGEFKMFVVFSECCSGEGRGQTWDILVYVYFHSQTLEHSATVGLLYCLCFCLLRLKVFYKNIICFSIPTNNPFLCVAGCCGKVF